MAKRFKMELEASERAAKLLMSSGKLSGWITRKDILKSMHSDTKATDDVINTLLVYGWMKARDKSGAPIYAISTKDEVQRANLQVMITAYEANIFKVQRTLKKTKIIKRAADRKAFKQKVKTYFSTRWNSLGKWYKVRVLGHNKDGQW